MENDITTKLAIKHLKELQYLDTKKSENEFKTSDDEIKSSCKKFQKDNDLILDGKLNSITKYTLFAIADSSKLNSIVKNYAKNNAINLSLNKIKNSIKNLAMLDYLDDFSNENELKSACESFQEDMNFNINGNIDQLIYDSLEKICNMESPLDYLTERREYKKTNSIKNTSIYKLLDKISNLKSPLNYLSQYQKYNNTNKIKKSSRRSIDSNFLLYQLGYLSENENDQSHIKEAYKRFQLDIGISQTGNSDKRTYIALKSAKESSTLFNCLIEYKESNSISSIRQTIFMQGNPISLNLLPKLFGGELYLLLKSSLFNILHWNDLEQLRISVGQLNTLGYIETKDITYADIEDACKQFQDNIGLKKDGILGPKTQAALWKSESPILSLFFPSNVTLRNIQDIKVITRKREIVYRFYLLFLLSFLGIVLVWPFSARLVSSAWMLLYNKADISSVSSFLVSLADITGDFRLSETLKFNSSAGGILLAFLNTLPVLFIISFLSERAIEILLTSAFGWNKNSITDQILFYENLAAFLSDNPNAFLDAKSFPGNLMQQREYSKDMIPKFLQKINELKKVLSNCNAVATKVAYTTSFSLGTLCAFSGVRLIEPLLAAELPDHGLQPYLLRWIDIILTSILISGGSEVAHRIYKGTIDFSVFTQVLQGGASNIGNSISNLIPGSKQPASPRESSETKTSK